MIRVGLLEIMAWDKDVDPAFILYGVLIFSWVEFVWEAYLSIRQRRIYRKNTTTPPELKGIVDDETFEKVNWNYSFHQSIINCSEMISRMYLPIISNQLIFRLDCMLLTNQVSVQFKGSLVRCYQPS